MPTPDVVRQIVDFGGLVLFILTTALIAWGGIKDPPWWVPGHVHRREIARGDVDRTQAERNADALGDILRLLEGARDRERR